MAAIYTTYAVGEILKELRNSGGTFPGTWYAGLFTVTPAIDGTGGTEVNSATHVWYSRLATTWAAPSGRSMANSGALSFTTSATGSTIVITSMGIFDASSSGNLWIILPLTTSLTVGVGSQVVFPIGQVIQEFVAA